MDLAQWQAAVRTVPVAHGEASYAEFGKGTPVVLLHGVGFTAGGHDFFGNVEALAGAGFRVIAPDLVGWGGTSRLQQSYSFARLVDFVRELQDALEIPRWHVIGHSMGGWIASLFAYESPERVDKLVLEGAGGAATRPLSSMTEFQPPSLDEAVATLVGRTTLDDAAARPWTEYALERMSEPEALASYRRILAHMSDPETRNIYNMLRRYPHITARTLVVWGTNDQVNALELGETVAKAIPGAQLVTVESGHSPHTERPEEYNRHVADFLTA